MASIANDPNGRKRILFKDTNGDRKAIRLGKMSKRNAEQVKLRIEFLLAAKMTSTTPDEETTRWVAGLDDVLYGKLEAIQLVTPREKQNKLTLKAFLDTYIESRTDIKPFTMANYKQGRRTLLEFFCSERELSSITPGDAIDFRRSLSADKLAENTVRKRCGIAKMFMAYACDKGYIKSNPFSKVGSVTVRSDRKKFHFVTVEEIQAILENCHSNEWRLLVALARFGGLRVPSEVLALTWGDINWAENTIRVPSPKTEHIEGRESRIIPLFNDIRPYLEAAFEEAKPGSVHVITRTRNAGVNLRTQLLRIMGKAGINPWPRLWHNMRATRATELAQKHPAHVVGTWLGHTPQVSAEFYLRTTQQDYGKALEENLLSSISKAAQNPARTDAELGSMGKKSKNKLDKKTLDLQGLTAHDGYCTNVQVLPEGIEPSTY